MANDLLPSVAGDPAFGTAVASRGGSGLGKANDVVPLGGHAVVSVSNSSGRRAWGQPVNGCEPLEHVPGNHHFS